MVALGDDIAQDKARRKSAQHDIEAKYGGKRHERDQDEHRKAHERLGSRIGALLNKGKEAAADTLGAAGDHGKQHTHHGEQAQDQQRLDTRTGRQQHRHGEHGAKLTPRTVGKNRIADARPGKRPLAQDGHERPKRRRGQRQRHGDAIKMTDRKPRGKAHG